MAFVGVSDVSVPSARFVFEVVLRTQFGAPSGWSFLGSPYLAVTGAILVPDGSERCNHGLNLIPLVSSQSGWLY